MQLEVIYHLLHDYDAEKNLCLNRKCISKNILGIIFLHDVS